MKTSFIETTIHLIKIEIIIDLVKINIIIYWVGLRRVTI